MEPSSVQVSDSVPSHPSLAKKAPKRRKHAEEGRVARELDLRMDVDDTEGMPGLPELDAPNIIDIELDIPTVDLDGLKGPNAQFGLPPVLDRMDIGALDELNDMVIGDEDLETLKDLNIDEDVWNELRTLKEQMDDLRSELEEDRDKGMISNYRLNREAEAIIEAVRAEMPRVRREVQKALQECKDKEGRSWQ